jgi:hypothetical protein
LREGVPWHNQSTIKILDIFIYVMLFVNIYTISWNSITQVHDYNLW